MSDSENKRLTQKFVDDAWNGGRYDEARPHLASDFVNHTPFGEETRDDFLARSRRSGTRSRTGTWALLDTLGLLHQLGASVRATTSEALT